MTNGHFNVSETQDSRGKWFVRVDPKTYSASEMTCTEAATMAGELTRTADKVRRLNNPPRAFYDRKA